MALHGLATNQVKHGAEVDLCVFNDGGTQIGNWDGIRINSFSKGKYKGFSSSREFNQFLNLWTGDLIHSHGLWAYPSAVVPKISTKNKIPFVVSPHGMLDAWALDHSKFKKRIFHYLFEKRHLTMASCIHALCPPEREAIQNYGLHNPVSVIPNGIKMPDSHAVQRRDTGKRRLLYLGRIHPKKGLDKLIQAWSQLKMESNHWQCIIVGWDDGDHEKQLIHLAHEVGFKKAQRMHPRVLIESDESLIFCGPVYGDTKTRLLQSVDAFILPSHSEGLPMSVLEAWSFGLPVVMTPQCNLDSGFTQKAAIKVKPESYSVFEGLKTLTGMSDVQRGEMGMRGRELVENQYTWDKVRQAFHQVYTWAIHGGNKPECMIGNELL